MTSSANKQLLKDGTLLFVSTLIVNAGNYFINLVFGRWLGPEEFSEVSLLVTLILMLSFLALGFQLTAARFVAEFAFENNQDVITAFVKWLRKLSLVTGIILGILLGGLSFLWRDFFNINSIYPFMILAAGIPFYLVMSANRGILQGKARYRMLAVTYQVEMWSRLILSIGLVMIGFKVNGVALGLALSLIITLFISNSHGESSHAHSYFPKGTALRFLFMVLIYECSQILINNSDTLLVKHYFKPVDAGLYAALALIGRIVYFGTWTVVTLLFPTVIRLEKEGKDHSAYFWSGLAIVIVMASMTVAGCYLFPSLIVETLFGNEYVMISPLLWQYALATALFACANVFVYYHLSLERRTPVWMTVFAGIMQIVLIILLHKDFAQVILVQVVLMAVLLLAMCVYHFIHYAQKKLQ
jgi:O-antigen/teichoic acid export membrane protein